MANDELIHRMMEDTLEQSSDADFGFEVRRLCAKKAARALHGVALHAGLFRFDLEGLVFDLSAAHALRYQAQFCEALSLHFGRSLEVRFFSAAEGLALVYWQAEQEKSAA